MFLASSLIVFATSIYRILYQKSSGNAKVLAQLHHFWHFVPIRPVRLCISIHFRYISIKTKKFSLQFRYGFRCRRPYVYITFKMGFRVFRSPFRRCTPCRKSQKTAGASQIILKFPLRFLQKALAFFGGIRYA